MSVLVLAEHDNRSLRPATLSTLSAAFAITPELDVLVAGRACDSVVEEAARIPGVLRVRVADHACYEHALPENVAPLVHRLAGDYSHIFGTHSTTGKNILPRVSALLDVQMISDIIEVESGNTFKRPIYAGNAIATVKTLDKIIVVSVRSTGFDACDAEGGAAETEELDLVFDSGLSHWIHDDFAVSERPELSAARVVVSGGRGLGSTENFALLDGVADQLGAAIGASRAAVDSGFVPNDMQVGQTGKIVAPDLYIAVGISGAIQHLAGMKDSKVIVAINKDEEAPIFQIADYGLVADLFTAVPELQKALSA